MLPKGVSYHSQYMNSMKLVIPLHSVYWSIHTEDESKRGTAFAFIFGVYWLWHCGVIASFGVYFHEIKCNGITNFMEFMSIYRLPCEVHFQPSKLHDVWSLGHEDRLVLSGNGTTLILSMPLSTGKCFFVVRIAASYFKTVREKRFSFPTVITNTYCKTVTLYSGGQKFSDA